MATSVPETSVPEKIGIKARLCRWTLNNYSNDDVDKLRAYATGCRYLVFGYEIAPTTGTPHLQGFVSWDSPRSFDKFKASISPSLSVRTCDMPAKVNAEYCKKTDTKDPAKPPPGYEEFGEIPRQGERTDWCVALSQIKSGSPVEEVVENQPQLLPCIRALDTFKAKLLKPLNRDVEVIVLWGDAGSGKSRWAYETYPNLYSKPVAKASGNYFDGYTGQDTLLLDDFYGDIKYTDLLRVIDRYPYHAPVSGSHVWAQWNRVIITSNKPPEKWYAVGLTPALRRRLHKIFFYSIDAPPQIYSPPAPDVEEA